MTVSAQDVQRARGADIIPWLCARFEHVRISRNRRGVGVDGVLRADLKEDGWISCDWYGGAIGDTISLVRMVQGCSFAQAVEELIGNPVFSHRIPAIPSPPSLERPRMPLWAQPEKGRDYLRSRGISPDTILEAERCGALVHARGGIAFLGRDDLGDVRLVNLRLFKPLPPRDGLGKPLEKFDLTGSNKAYPVILPGKRAGMAFVEGGVNLLAARDMLTHMGCPGVSVLATGGVGIRSFLERENVRKMVERAEICWFFWEREYKHGVESPGKQALTDPYRWKFMHEVAQLRAGDMPEILMPPVGCGDVADWNALVQQHPPCAGPGMPVNYTMPVNSTPGS